MNAYKLIELDDTESNKVRRALHRWSKVDEQAVMPLILAIRQKYDSSNFQIEEPRWVTNVYPLYYWAYNEMKSQRGAYDHVLELLPTLFPLARVSLPAEELRAHLRHIVNSEIDILIEDSNYFFFVEVKIPTTSQKIRFQKTAGVHQLVRQYVQGKILEKIMGKMFALATLGANNAQTKDYQLNPIEQELLRLVGHEEPSLRVHDFDWSLLRATA